MREASPRGSFSIIVIICFTISVSAHRNNPLEPAHTSDNDLLTRLPDIFLVFYDPIRVDDGMCGFCNLFIAQQVVYYQRNLERIRDSACMADKH